MKQTPFFEKHAAFGARMVDFSGWQMPIQYADGIVAEHLTTRKHAGLFDVSHMGRFHISGAGATAFLRHVLTNDCEKLVVGQAHYTMIANETGGAVDDAFLYRPDEEKYLLVVNASNKDKDWQHLQDQVKAFGDAVLDDVSDAIAMLALQGPESEAILQTLVTGGTLPEPKRNSIGQLKLCGVDVTAARTGYTGEPVCFELFMPAESARPIWDKLIAAGVKPVGLGARDTLRLEAGLPLYGHELGMAKDGNEIPIFAIPLAAFAVSFEDEGRDFVGRAALEQQAAAKKRYKAKDFSNTAAVPKIVRQVRLLDKGIARDGSEVYYQGEPVGWVTSGTMVPYWAVAADNALTDEHAQRAVGLCMIAPNVPMGSEIEVEVRGRKLKAKIVARNLENRKVNTTYAVI
ncbi:MAG: glycine cleavage system aminomethyltransferase GcvT [Planctomycetota bacterium]